MIDIDKYIEASSNMSNTSDGGSVAYHFDDVVLVKYQCNIKYGIAREGEEQVAEEANKKRAKGVRTPAHLAIKRVVEGDNSICWVLQERAKGKSFNDYCYIKNPQIQLEMQALLANAPESHYEQLISDVCELFNLGLELKPKNMFYDESINSGGFTIIDLLSSKSPSFDPNSLKDVLYLDKTLQGIYNCSCLSSFDKNVSKEEVIASRQLYYKIRQKIFLAMEKVIPNFQQHRRNYLRSMPVDVLEFFNQNGTFVGDLALNEQEQKQFDINIESIVDNFIGKIANGENKLWEIYANEIRIDLDEWGLQSVWLYHIRNKRNLSEFSGEYADYDYRRECAKDLEEIVKEKFDERLCDISIVSTNLNIMKAKSDYDKMQHENLRSQG